MKLSEWRQVKRRSPLFDYPVVTITQSYFSFNRAFNNEIIKTCKYASVFYSENQVAFIFTKNADGMDSFLLSDPNAGGGKLCSGANGFFKEYPIYEKLSKRIYAPVKKIMNKKEAYVITLEFMKQEKDGKQS